MAKISKAVLTEKVKTYLALQAQIKELQAQVDDIKSVLSEEAGKAESNTLILGDYSVKLSERTRESINVKDFTAAHPRLAAKFTKTTTYNVLMVK